MTSEETVTPERMNAFSDAVFAVIITILVLKLRPPKEASFGALLELWPTAVSYAISYLFAGIIRAQPSNSAHLHRPWRATPIPAVFAPDAAMSVRKSTPLSLMMRTSFASWWGGSPTAMSLWDLAPGTILGPIVGAPGTAYDPPR
jgi:hypothetical protein